MTMAMASANGENIVVAASAAGPRMKKLASMLCMKGGNGDGSYLNNSQAQVLHAPRMIHFLEETLDAMLEHSSKEKLFTVADLGCSCGSNTLFIVDVIVRRVAKAYESSSRDVPEFQVFFSDLPSNDFNTLFQLLPALLAPAAGSLEECLAAGEGSTATRPYLAAGVPGTFYGRLFPGESINVFTSTFSLHWLSQVPEEVTDGRSAAYNGGRVFVHRATEAAAAAAFKGQFQTDLARFLQSRARELKRGGAMFLACLGRSSADPVDQGGAGLLFGTHFQDAWDDLVREGVVEREKRDSFNIPLYAPSLQEFRDVVCSDGSFVIDRLELVRGGSPLVVDRPDDAAEIGRAMANS